MSSRLHRRSPSLVASVSPPTSLPPARSGTATTELTPRARQVARSTTASLGSCARRRMRTDFPRRSCAVSHGKRAGISASVLQQRSAPPRSANASRVALSTPTSRVMRRSAPGISRSRSAADRLLNRAERCDRSRWKRRRSADASFRLAPTGIMA